MIPEYNTILFATDLAENSLPVFKMALSVAKKYDARIHMLHVVPEMDSSHLNYLEALIGEEKFKEQSATLNRQIVETLKERLRKFVDEEMKGRPDSLELVTDIEVLHGHPADKILQTAQRLDADLMVFGSHGKGYTEHTWLGSVVHRVLRKTRYPVIVVPAPE